jgi:hypothetical protein
VADKARHAQWEQARTLYPSAEYGSRTWVDFFEAYPDVLTKLLGDVYRVYKAEQAKKVGSGNPAGGRRRSQVNGNLDELWSILTPRYSMEPFSISCKELMGEQSLRAFAARCGMDHRELSRYLRGTSGRETSNRYTPEVYWLERIALAADVHPAYFVEWRVATLVGILSDAMAKQPELSITAIKSLGRRPA